MAAECVTAAKILWPLLTELGTPKQWTCVVICDEAAWRQVEDRTDQMNLKGKILALSNLDGRMTFIRGSEPYIHSVNVLSTSRGTPSLTSWDNRAEKEANELLNEPRSKPFDISTHK